MPIVVGFGLDAQGYMETEGQQACPRPADCEHCGVSGRMVGHGSYRRKPKDRERAYQVHIKRWRCQGCGKTTSCLPDFLLSWRHYLVGVVGAVLVRRVEAGASWSEVVVGCSNEGLPGLRTMQRWVGAFASRAGVWLLAVAAELAQQDSGSPWLEPRGPTEVKGAGAAQALLVATLYLLAWAKTRWGQLEGYGVGDRLAFLWQWGSGHGLGRLV